MVEGAGLGNMRSVAFSGKWSGTRKTTHGTLWYPLALVWALSHTVTYHSRELGGLMNNLAMDSHGQLYRYYMISCKYLVKTNKGPTQASPCRVVID